MHVTDTILNDPKEMIGPKKIQHVARLGGDWYCKVDKGNLFRVPKPNSRLGIGVDALQMSFRLIIQVQRVKE